ncbi:hypothetical protein ACHAXT_009382 [Thalassiosira profunda]
MALNVNDPVTVDSSDGAPLEGVVAHLGPVQFAPGPDWIGIRLTGPSAGKGKNDGSVKGEKYFECGGEGNGMFAKKANVKKRTLTKLESLRLKRELDLGSGGGSTRATRASTRATRSSARLSSGASAPKSPVKSPARSPTASGLQRPSRPSTGGRSDRLEELRAKREALKQGRAGSAASSRESLGTPIKEEVIEEEEENEEGEEEAKEEEGGDEGGKDESKEEGEDAESPIKINLSNATPGYRAELTRLQARISSLETTLEKKEKECKSLQSTLDFMSKGAEQSTHDAVRMYAMGALALTEAKSPAGKGAKKEEGEEEGGSDKESGDEDDGEEGDGNEAVVSQAAAAVSSALVERNDELTKQLSELNSKNADLQHQLGEAEERISNVQHRFEEATERHEGEKATWTEESRGLTADRAVATSKISSLERELSVLQERVSAKSETEGHSHVTLAKLRAELTSLQRKTEELENDKMELEVTMEELVLDKEGLGQEKEILEDQLEEAKIDLESAQLELEDAKAQLEEQRGAEAAAVEGAVAGGEAGADESFSSAGADSQDVARSLSAQNTRLRTALIRLREQSEHERGELQRQLKAVQSDATDREAVQSELESLKSAHATTLSEMKELQDMVDQTSSLEETIETLGDKVFDLEERNADLERTVREQEEAAEIAAEMEEVQAEELKMVMRDLEGRDALVGNLEEAIRMQRRREEDFQRYVSEFRTSVSTLKQEKAALLALTEDDSGEKSQLLATSRKALAQAAQLATDAAEARKISAEAAFQTIAARSAAHLSRRLESLLPAGAASAEIAAVKGEMGLARVADKAAASLSAVEDVFSKAIEGGSSGISEFDTLEEGGEMVISDARRQQIATMTHQAGFASMAIEAGTDALRLMAAGQWPDLLSQEVSTDLGGAAAHSVADLDLALSEQLQLLKSEGTLSPLRSSLADLDQSVRNTRLALFGATDEGGKAVIPDDWKPPGWEALKFLSLGRFSCLGATAVLSSAVGAVEGAEDEPPPATPPNFADVLSKAKQSCASILDVCKMLAGLRLDDDETLSSLNELSLQYRECSLALLDCVKTAFEVPSITSEDVANCAVPLENVNSAVRQLAALLRNADLGEQESSSHHFLSPEFGDAWGGVTEIVSQVRSVDGDPEDVNYLMRSRSVESQLAEAVENEPKLVIASAKITSLEKSLSSRSKEIQMQNSRIAELERLIQASSASPISPMKGSRSPGKSAPSADAEKLTEEVRVLQEALDVMQKQAEEYEKEIRSLKDKSRPSRGVRTAGGRTTPKKSSSMDLEATLNQLQTPGSKSTGSRDVLLESISLETALFRPALSSAVQSANHWKGKAMGSALSKLAPLNVPVVAQSVPSSAGVEANKALDELLAQREMAAKDRAQCLDELALARKTSRMAKASFSIAELSRGDASSRTQLNEERRKDEVAQLKLQKAADSWLKLTHEDSLAPSLPPGTQPGSTDPLGRITLPCRSGTGFVAPLTVNAADLRNLHSFLVQ